MSPLESKTPHEIRRLARTGKLTGPTGGLAPGHLQANLAMVPRVVADDFQAFCEGNPKPCPLLEMTEPGSFQLLKLASGVDLRTDLPKYRVYQKGALVEEPVEITGWWRDDLVSFLLGCSFSFEEAMLRSSLPVRHIEEGRNIPMYLTNIPCKPAGIFRGNTVVSMRPLKPTQVKQVVDLTSRYSFAHGAPLQIGDPMAIGIHSLDHPDFGESVTIYPDEVPVFWACGVTSQIAILEAKIELAITHNPGSMFVSDIKSDDLL